MLEVYNDSLYDLLLPPGEVSRPLEVSGLAAGELPAGMERVQGAMWRPVNCLEDVKKVRCYTHTHIHTRSALPYICFPVSMSTTKCFGSPRDCGPMCAF